MWPDRCTVPFILQAQLALPVLVVVQAVTPPFLLAGPLKRRRLEPWRGLLHATNVVFAVLLARFAIFDILQVRGQPPLAWAATPLGFAFISRLAWRTASIGIFAAAVHVFVGYPIIDHQISLRLHDCSCFTPCYC